MKRHLITFLFLVFSLHVGAQIPGEAKELLVKLSNWELTRQAELQKEIQVKRNEVAKLLQAMLEQKTKSGDLEGALAIKIEIERIQLPLVSEVKGVSNLPTNRSNPKAPELDWFVGKTWKSQSGTTTFAFEPEGKGIKTYKEVPRPVNWEILESGVVRVFGNGAPEFFRFTGRRKGEIGKTETLENSIEIQPE